MIKKLFLVTTTIFASAFVKAQVLPKYDSAHSSFVDSNIYSIGNSVGFGTASPTYAFDSNLGYARFSYPGATNGRFFQIIPGYQGNGDIPAGSYISAGSSVAGEGLSLLPNGGGNTGVKLGSYVYAKNKWTSVWETKNEDANTLPSIKILKGGGWANFGDFNNSEKTNISLNGTVVSQSNTDVSFQLVQGTNVPYWDAKAKKLCIQMPSWSANGNAYIDLGGDNANINNALYISYNSGRDTYINTNSDPNAPNKGGTVYLGKTRIGSKRPTSPHDDAMLSVDGKILAKSVIVNISSWADYVFADNYKLSPLSDVESYIKQNKHLPNIPAASEIEKNGLDVGTIQSKQMEKIEELTLYLIELNKKVEAQARTIESQAKEIQSLKSKQ